MTAESLNLRKVEVFRPYDNETPEDLLWAEHLPEAQVDRWLSAEMVRIAKLNEEAVALYAMDRGDGETYLLHGLVVDRSWRRQGLGRWLVGHAIGVAESKGGRHVLFPQRRAKRFLSLIGFVEDPRGQRFDLIQE